MPKSYPVPHCSERHRQLVDEWAKSRTTESRLVERAKIIQRCLHGDPVKKIAQELDVRPNTVIDWRRRFEAKGIAGLKDVPRVSVLRLLGHSNIGKAIRHMAAKPHLAMGLIGL